MDFNLAVYWINFYSTYNQGTYFIRISSDPFNLFNFNFKINSMIDQVDPYSILTSYLRPLVLIIHLALNYL